MPQDPALTEREKGKRVVTPDGDEVGRILSVENNVAAVEADPGITDRIRSALGWGTGGSDADTYRLQAADVRAVHEETVVVEGEFGSDTTGANPGR